MDINIHENLDTSGQKLAAYKDGENHQLAQLLQEEESKENKNHTTTTQQISSSRNKLSDDLNHKQLNSPSHDQNKEKIESEAYKNPEQVIANLQFLNKEQKDSIIACLKNLNLLLKEGQSCIVKYGTQEEISLIIQKTLNTANDLFFQMRSIVAKLSGSSQHLLQCEQGDKKDEINIPLTVTVINILNILLTEIVSICQSICIPKLKKKLSSYKNDLIIVSAKANTLSEFFPYVISFSKDDIFSVAERSESADWQLINKHLEAIQIDKQQVMKKSFNTIAKAILMGNAMSAKGAEGKSSAGKCLLKTFSACCYSCRPTAAKRKAHIFFAQPDPVVAISVWNILDKTFLYQAIKIVLPSIKYCKKIYIDSSGFRFNKTLILQEIRNGTLNKITPIPSAQFVQIDKVDSSQNSYYAQLFQENQSKVKIRILSSEKLVRPQPGYSGKWHTSVMIHIHGGGFVAMSTRSHQTYSRKWANLLKIPIFSIDYSKAPEHPYPEGLDDCFQVYQWVLKHISNVFNIKPEKIIIGGDSAGGNFTVALTSLCIKYGIRPPTGILPVYPALNLNLKDYTPSYLLALEDQILPHMFLKICLNSYIEKDSHFDASQDPFLSPICTSNEILSQFPPVRMQVGNCDPFQDDCHRFLLKLLKLNKNAKLILYNDMTHGYLGFGGPGGMKQANKCVIDASEQLKQLIEINQVADHQVIPMS